MLGLSHTAAKRRRGSPQQIGWTGCSWHGHIGQEATISVCIGAILSTV
jgi:hypothetical protein